MPTKLSLPPEVQARYVAEYESLADELIVPASSVVSGVRVERAAGRMYVRYRGKPGEDRVYVYFGVLPEVLAAFDEERAKIDGSINGFVRSKVSPNGAMLDYALLI